MRVDLGISSSLVIKNIIKAVIVTESKVAFKMTIRSLIDAYLQILLYTPKIQKDAMVEVDTIKVFNNNSCGNSSSLNQYAPQKAVTAHIPSIVDARIRRLVLFIYWFPSFT